jgi:hypothetical protein
VGQLRSSVWRFIANACGLTAVAGLVSCSDEPRVPRAGQVVKPLMSAPAFRWISPKIPTVSLYEYYDKITFRITGKRIDFDIPRPYFDYPSDFNGGPQLDIGVEYVRGNPEVPIGFKWLPQKDQSSNPDAEVLALTPYSDHLTDAKIGDLEQGLRIPQYHDPGTSIRLRYGNTQQCGYQIFFSETADKSRYPTRYQAPRSPQWPIQTAALFAKPTPNQTFFPVVGCSRDIHADGFPLCQVNTEYRGWPLRINFSARKLCETENVIAAAQKFLDQYRVNEAPRAPGFAENRHSLAELNFDPAGLPMAMRGHLLESMPAKLQIETARRETLSYFFKPLTDQMSLSFTEG